MSAATVMIVPITSQQLVRPVGPETKTKPQVLHKKPRGRPRKLQPTEAVSATDLEAIRTYYKRKNLQLYHDKKKQKVEQLRADVIGLLAQLDEGQLLHVSKKIKAFRKAIERELISLKNDAGAEAEVDDSINTTHD
jgi:hypothetical protein